MQREKLERLADYMPGDPHNLEMSRKLRQPLDDFKGYLRQRNRPLQKLQFFLADTTERPAIMAELRRRFPETAVSFSQPHNVEVNIKNAVKGEGLRFLCGHLGIPLAEAAAFGDGVNDVSMLETAGVGVAMANGEPEALAAAKYRTGTNQEDGVAQFLEAHVL